MQHPSVSDVCMSLLMERIAVVLISGGLIKQVVRPAAIRCVTWATI